MRGRRTAIDCRRTDQPNGHFSATKERTGAPEPRSPLEPRPARRAAVIPPDLANPAYPQPRRDRDAKRLPRPRGGACTAGGARSARRGRHGGCSSSPEVHPGQISPPLAPREEGGPGKEGGEGTGGGAKGLERWKGRWLYNCGLES